MNRRSASRVSSANRTPRESGATAAVTGIKGKSGAWLVHHGSVARESLSALMTDWLSSLMTWMVIGIALALPIILYVILVNVGALGEGWDGKPRISLYLKPAITEDEGRTLARKLEKQSDVEAITYISAHEALVEFRSLSGFGDVLDALDKNPLPAVLEVKPKDRDIARLRLQVVSFGELEQVATVKFDLAWIERLFALLQLGERLVATLGFVLALGVLLVIGNTIRLSIENRRSEIEIVKLVGGTDSYVRRPFLYLGFWYGLGGAMIATLLVQVSLVFLAAPVEVLAQSYRDDFSLTGLSVAGSLAVLSGGSLLGIIGALLSVGRHLSEIEPT